MKKLMPFFIVVAAITLLAGCPMTKPMMDEPSPLVGVWTRVDTYRNQGDSGDTIETITRTFTVTTYTETGSTTYPGGDNWSYT
ncbi:MAG: hypothetical protein ACR2PY_09640, partial [Salinispira sp.]